MLARSGASIPLRCGRSTIFDDFWSIRRT